MRSTHIRSHYRLPPDLKRVDLKRYEGTWQQKLAKPTFFTPDDAKDIKAVYKLQKNGKVRVINTYKKPAGGIVSIKGTAESISPDNRKLLIDFGLPANLLGKGDYKIEYVNSTYTRALVGTTNKNYLWLLTRKTNPTNDEINAIKKLARQKGYAIGDFK